MIPTSPLPVHTPLMPSQSIEISLPLNTIGPVMKMDPLNNLQVPKESHTEQNTQFGKSTAHWNLCKHIQYRLEALTVRKLIC